METTGRNNYACLRGTLAQPPVYSHENRRERFFRFALRTQRLSGTADTLNVLARERLLAENRRLRRQAGVYARRLWQARCAAMDKEGGP